MRKTTPIAKEQFRVGRAPLGSGLGLFATAPIERGQYIEYTGELISGDEANRRGGKYLFEINTKWTVDGKGRENVARYINHSCKPNMESETKGKQIFVVALKRIKPGEELCYDYGEEYFNDFLGPDKCSCPKHLGS